MNFRLSIVPTPTFELQLPLLVLGLLYSSKILFLHVNGTACEFSAVQSLVVGPRGYRHLWLAGIDPQHVGKPDK